MEKIGGVGLVNLAVIWFFVILATVAAKAILTQFHIPGLSEVVLAV